VRKVLFLLLIFPCILLAEPGEVHLVLGSDTAIWEGMNVRHYNCYYNVNLYTDPQRNAYRVMEPAFREQFVDSYGQQVKMTWWMMAGNIFRYASNKNVPLPNIMTMYLMQKYHGETIQQNGDELSLHYHTFAWTDYDGDGTFYWNQSLTFPECRADFDVTVAQFLLEENVYPVSFRSGWHYMDNDWQNYLDELLPYSLHNDWPAMRTDNEEPLDNTYDWSLAPETWVPYHPSPENYQLPGDGRGWNVRSDHMSSITQTMMDDIFEQANQGIDQVACIWAHLPESNFLDNIEKIDNLAHIAANKFQNVKFRYCTAIEAMQRWQKTTDTEAPIVTIEELPNGENVSFIIKTNEPIFQTQPFVAVKDVYERYYLLQCNNIARYKWQTLQSISKNQLAKIGVAVCDMVGNLTTDFINYLPDDIYIDNKSPGFIEEDGNWTTSTANSWGVDSRIATLSENEIADAKWLPNIIQPGYYNILVQVPPIANPAEQVIFKIYNNGDCVDTTIFNNPLPTLDWIYIGTTFFTTEGENYLNMTASGDGQAGKVLIADVAKFSALIPERFLYIEQNLIDFGEVSQDDTIFLDLKTANHGLENLTLSGVFTTTQTLKTQISFPVVIPGMSNEILPLQFSSPWKGIISDTLILVSDDPIEPNYAIPFNANVQSYFTIIDNENSLHYNEAGQWQTSVAEAYGPSSRFSYLNKGPGAYATFRATVTKPGIYEIFEIVPTTVNSTNHALYILSISNVPIDTVVIDQNEGSGNWVSIGKYNLPPDIPIEMKVLDTGKSTAGSVIRADAVKFALVEEFLSVENLLGGNNPPEFQLEQNFPNPFNSSTIINYSIREESLVKLSIYNSIGQKVATLINKYQQPGRYSASWNANLLTSGIYFYQLKTDSYYKVRKLIVIK